MGDKCKIEHDCADCGGTGTKSNILGEPVGVCPNCKGSGKIEVSRLDAKKILDKLDEILSKLN